MSQHFQVLIVGGGTAGIMVAAQLKLKQPSITIGLLEPSEKHYYQPAWTLVGAGTFDFKDTIRAEADQIPSGVLWIKEFADRFEPEHNKVFTRTGKDFTYNFLVLAPGIQIDLDGIPGLREALGQGNVCSNYVDPEYTWEVVKNFKGGNAVFTQPTTPIKCGGAPQKTMYLADDYFRKSGAINKTNVIYATPGSVIFGVKEFADTLNKVIQRKGIHVKYFYALSKIDPIKREVYFRYAKPGDNQCVVTENNKIMERIQGESEIVIPYDMLHLAPPQSAPDFIKKSPFAIQDGPSKGWIDVNKFTLQHNTYPNVFGLGDAANLPTAKTGAAIRKQAPVVVQNILRLIKENKLADSKYEGYSSCPLITGYGKMVLAEFKYDNVRDSDPFLSKFVDTTKENWSMWILKKYGLPYLYWNKMMKGKM
jgi:sulfide:quinone oxidoreductase